MGDVTMLGERCGMCGARALVPAARPDWLSCEWCGVESVRDAVRLPDLHAGRIEDQIPRGWHMDDYVARGWAAGQGFDYRADRTERARGHSPERASGTLTRIEPATPLAVALAILARDADDELRGWLDMSALPYNYGATVVVVDQSKTGDALDGLPVKVVAHRLNGDFGKQRDRAQAAVEAMPGIDWVLHVDTDEAIGLRIEGWLEGLTAIAEREGLDAIALPRMNVVDGVCSDLWPDPQYRLVRATQRYDGRVHERPQACRDWRRTMTVLSGGRGPEAAWTIHHALERAHVVARTQAYDALGQDSDRRADEEALLRPYTP